MPQKKLRMANLVFHLMRDIMGDVINISNLFETDVDIPPQKVLDRAAEMKLTDVVLIGWSEDGSMYYNQSMKEGPEALWLLAQAQRHLLKAYDDEDSD